MLQSILSVMTDKRAPTRKNLMELEEKVEFYQSGKETLEKKRDALVFELMDLIDEVRDLQDELGGQYEDAQDKLTMTRSMEGDIALKGAAAAQKEHFDFFVETGNIMGVVIPTFEYKSASREIDERGYGVVGTTARIDETAEAYEDLVDLIVKQAEVETAVRQLLEEIEETSRRVNALQERLIPDLKERRDEIEQSLMEQEREEIFRMKKVKEMNEEDDTDVDYSDAYKEDAGLDFDND